jgi:cytochrome c55X
MKGGLGPPLLPATLRDKDRAGLAHTILYGRPGTAMPPWKDFVSEAEAHWIVDQLMMGLPDER